MKIGWVSIFDTGAKRGGWQGMNHFLFKALQRNEADLTVIAPLKASQDSIAKWQSWVLTAFTGQRLVWSYSDRVMHQYAADFARRTQNLGIDTYLFFGCTGMYRIWPDKPFACYADSAFVPFLRFQATARNYTEREYNRLMRWEGDWFRQITRIFTSSEFARKEILNLYGIAEDKVLVVGSGANLEYDVPEVENAPRQRHVLFVGSHFLNKGGDIAVKAVEIARETLTDLELHVAGDMPPAEYQRDFVKAHGWIDRGTPEGRVKWEQLMRTSSIFLSLPKYDLTPGAICEAMAYGLPSLSYAVGGIPEMIADGQSGWLVRAQADPETVAKRLVDILSSPISVKQAEKEARLRFEHYWNWDSTAERIIEGLAG
jgi:glycosyltransferase involved in cell wall biosynthesis